MGVGIPPIGITVPRLDKFLNLIPTFYKPSLIVLTAELVVFNLLCVA